MPDKLGSWGKELASLWTNYLPPCRPSWSEMSIYTKYLRILQSTKPSSRLNLLILGSTSEFRDWGHQEGLNVTVIDFSIGYNKQIEQEMRHKTVQENFVHKSWQEMSFENEFDIIVGDLVIGNLKREEIPLFLENVSRALKPGGYFITKSFFKKDDFVARNLDEIFQDYKEHFSHIPLFPFLIYEIAIRCMDPETGILIFSHMYNEILKVHKKGIIDDSMLEVFNNLGWQKNMKFGFFIPTVSEWENMVREKFKIVNREKSNDIYSNDFFVYVLSNN
jgi:SAM-dependent methyltransferase